MGYSEQNIENTTRIAGGQLILGLMLTTNLPTKKDRTKLDMSKVEDVINDLIFDGWNNKKADKLLTGLASLETTNITKLDSPVAIVMERIQRLAKIREHADAGKGDVDNLYQMLEQGHQRVLELIRNCFKF